MRAYWAILSARFRMLLQYRAAALAGAGTQVFWGLIRIMIFGAFYAMPHASGSPMTWPQVVSYIWLGQAMLALLPMWNDNEMRNMIRDGSVAYELARPIDLYNLWFARALANRSAPTLLRSVPLVLIAGLFFGLNPPASVAAAGGWALSMFSALLLSCAISTLVLISTMWTVSGRGISDLMGPCVWIFSGIMLPIPLFPDWMQAVINAMPFRGLLDIPFRIYTGNLPTNEFAGALAHQLLWTAGLVLLGRWLLALRTQKLVIQGG